MRKGAARYTDAEIVAAWSKGKDNNETNIEIAKALGISLCTLHKCMSRWGLRCPVNLPIYGRKCRSCLEPLSPDKALRSGPRCIPCGRRHCRNGDCPCGYARHKTASKCPRCGREQTSCRTGPPAGSLRTAFIEALKAEPLTPHTKIGKRLGISSKHVSVLARRSGVDLKARRARIKSERLRLARLGRKKRRIACTTCGSSFSLLRGKGRPRRTCPTCRGVEPNVAQPAYETPEPLTTSFADAQSPKGNTP